MLSLIKLFLGEIEFQNQCIVPANTARFQLIKKCEQFCKDTCKTYTGSCGYGNDKPVRKNKESCYCFDWKNYVESSSISNMFFFCYVKNLKNKKMNLIIYIIMDIF